MTTFEHVLIHLKEAPHHRAKLPDWTYYHLRVREMDGRLCLVIFSEENDGWHYAELPEEELMSDKWRLYP